MRSARRGIWMTTAATYRRIPGCRFCTTRKSHGQTSRNPPGGSRSGPPTLWEPLGYPQSPDHETTKTEWIQYSCQDSAEVHSVLWSPGQPVASAAGLRSSAEWRRAAWLWAAAAVGSAASDSTGGASGRRQGIDPRRERQIRPAHVGRIHLIGQKEAGLESRFLTRDLQQL